MQPARRMQRRRGGRERRWSRGRRRGCIRSPAGRSASAARRPRRLLPALAAGRRSAWRMAGLFGAHLRALAPTRRRFGRGGSTPLVFLHSVGEALCRAKRGPWGRGQWGDGHRGGNDPMCGQVSRSGCVDSQQREKDVLSTCARRTEAGRKVETADRSSIVPRRWTPSAVIGMREACSSAGGADATTWRCRRGGLGLE